MYPARRDKNEKPIVTALRKAGASVEYLSAMGCPDLLVGYRGVNYLIEIKAEHGKCESHGKKTESGLRDTQERWWRLWRGMRPIVATTSEEALRAIGVELLV